MDRAGPGAAGGGDDLRAVEIGGNAGRSLDQQDLVRCGEGRRAPVRLVGDHRGPEPEAARGADDPERNLAAVGDQQRVEGQAAHRRPLFGRTMRP